MKLVKLLSISALLVLFALTMTLTGCAQENMSGQTIDEPEITVDYLEGEYADQLLRDGAEHVFGNIEISVDENGETLLLISAKEFVEDDTQPNGFYIADRNLNVSCGLAQEARVTFLSGGTSLAVIMTPEEFLAAVEQDFIEYGNDEPDYFKTKYYDIYAMNGQAELILAKYIP